MIELIKPSKDYYGQYKDMMDEWHAEGGKIAPWPLSLDYDEESQFDAMLEHLDNVENGKNVNGFASSTTFWVYDRAQDKMIGATNIRHKIVGESGNLWGHIGYGIRPSERKKGYATQVLKMAMEKARKRSIKNIYVAAYTENIWSIKTIEKCGFDFEGTLIDKECNKEVRKYCYSYRKKFADSVKDYEGVEETIMNSTYVEDAKNNFKGIVWLNKFSKVSKKRLLPSGKPFLDTNYKWLEFYDYDARNRLTAMYDDKNEIVEWYYDVARKIGEENGVPYEDDLYLDVVFMPDGTHILLDEDELEQAYKNNEIATDDYNRARAEAKRIIAETDVTMLKKFTDKYINEN